jgi:PAS domain S-box-containing protein
MQEPGDVGNQLQHLLNSSRHMLMGIDEEGSLRIWYPQETPVAHGCSPSADATTTQPSHPEQPSEYANSARTLPAIGASCSYTLLDPREFEAQHVALKVMSGHDQPAALRANPAAEKQKEAGFSEISLKGVKGDCINIVVQPAEESKTRKLIGALYLSQEILSVHPAPSSHRRKGVAAPPDAVRQFTNQANVVCIVVDAEGRITDWNKAASDAVGYTSNQVLNRPIFDLADAGDTKDLPCEKLEKFVLSFRQDGQDRSVKLLLSATPLGDEQFVDAGYMLIGHDFTDRWQQEQEDKHMATELKAFMRSANAPIFGTDLQGRVNEWNDKAQEITGFAIEEVMGRNLFKDFTSDNDFSSEKHRERIDIIFMEALTGHETPDFELPLITADKRVIVVLLNLTTKRNVSGEPIGVIGFGQDITERKSMEIEKETVAQELQMFIETANAPIFGIDERGLVNEWNNKVHHITGFSREEALGKDFVQVRVCVLHIHVSACIYVCVGAFTYVCSCMHIRVSVRAYVYVCARTQVCLCVYAFMFVRARIHVSACT